MGKTTTLVFCGTDGHNFCSVGCQARGEHRDWALCDPWIAPKCECGAVLESECDPPTCLLCAAGQPEDDIDEFERRAWER